MFYWNTPWGSLEKQIQEHAGTSFHLLQEVKRGKSYTNVTQQQSQRRSMTPLNFAWRVRARRGPLLISTHSQMPLSWQRSLKITACKKISLPLPHSQPVIDTLTQGMNTSARAENRHLDSISCLDPLNSRASWNVLSPCCPGRAIFIPVQPLCSSTCHLHSELPAADLLTASEREGSHNSSAGGEVYWYSLHTVFSCHYVPLLMEGSIFSHN